jgi:anthranilate synthase/aminodeoxychorismate synthase-like glutamine amidotransferase
MILLIDNYDSFTWNLVQRLGELDPSLEPDRDLVVYRNDKITADEAQALDAGAGPSHVIISPGPCTPAEAGISAAIVERFAGRVPVLGVCLGHQTMAAINAMQVTRHVVPVHGKTSLIHHDAQGIFAGLPDPFEAARYHSLVVPVESVPPPPAAGEDGWVVSAWTDEPVEDEPRAQARGPVPTRRVVMGLRRVWADDASSAPLVGVQFHPESFLTLEGPRLLANFLAMGPRGWRVDESRIAAIGP